MALAQTEPRQLPVERRPLPPVRVLRELLELARPGRAPARPRRARRSAVAVRRPRRGGGAIGRRRSPRPGSVRRCAAASPPPRGRPRPSSRRRRPPATRDSRRRTAPPTPSSTTHSFSHTVSSSRRSCDTTSERRRRAGHERLDRLAGRDVEVVRRLVEQQQVRRLDAEQRQLQARPLPAGQRPDLLGDVVAAEQEPGEVRARLARRDRDGLEQRVEDGRARDRRLAQLREVAELDVVAERERPVERRQLPGDRAQERGLARAVRADDADPLAALGGQERRRGDDAAARSPASRRRSGAPRPGRYPTARPSSRTTTSPERVGPGAGERGVRDREPATLRAAPRPAPPGAARAAPRARASSRTCGGFGSAGRAPARARSTRPGSRRP